MKFRGLDLLKLAGVVVAALAVAECSAAKAEDGAQKGPPTVAIGYISAVQSASKFDVDGTHVTTSSATHYGLTPMYQLIGKPDVANAAPSAEALRVGMWVEVTGVRDKRTKSATADSVLFRDDWDRKIKGFGVIDRVIQAGPGPLYQVDGYRMRIPSRATSTFSGGIKSLTDVGTNTWVGYEGKVDQDGVLVAAQVKFVSGISDKTKSDQSSKDSATKDAIPPQSLWIDPDGNFHDGHAKVRLSDAGGWCGWHRIPQDRSLQERVNRVGTRVVPAYQKQMAADEAAKVHFRFYVVDEPQIRSELVCKSGLILVPRQAVARFHSDDQLAAVLSDGVAFSLQLEEAKIASNKSLAIGGEIADYVLLAADPLSFIIVNNGIGPVVMHPIVIRMQEQRGRIALALMTDAGYDPWQAPEAWRLLAPKSAEKDPNSLKYPNRSWYQLGILNLQYGKKAKDREQGAGNRE